MNKISFLVLIMTSLALSSCNSNNSNENAEQNNTKPLNLSIIANVIGKDIDHPNGDESGKVDFTINATNATSYKILIDGKTFELTENEFTYTFKSSGTDHYTVIVSAYNSGQFISETISVKIYVIQHLLWADEFDIDGSPDPNKWGYDLGTGNGWGNNESQYYTDRTENVTIANGILKITLKREDYHGSEFTSTRMLTKGKFEFTYGKVEIRAKLPQGGGTWPALWLLGANISSVGWPACGEIDIMEHIGNNQGTVQSAMHTPSSSGATINHGATVISDVSSAFHVYAVEWTEEKMVFTVDNNVHYIYEPSVKNEQTWPYTKNQFIILNIAMGGNFGGAIDSNFSESSMEIDYIKVYQ